MSENSVLSRTREALERNQFKVFVASSREDAVNKVLELIPLDANVGVGGSVTIRELGLIEALIRRGIGLFIIGCRICRLATGFLL